MATPRSPKAVREEEHDDVAIRCSIVLATVPFATPVLAQDMDVSKITCKEFVSAPKDQISTLLTWLEEYYTKENAPPIMYSAKTMKDAKGLSRYCNDHPGADLITAAEAVMPVK